MSTTSTTDGLMLCGHVLHVGDFVEVQYHLQRAAVFGRITKLWYTPEPRAEIDNFWCFGEGDEIREHTVLPSDADGSKGEPMTKDPNKEIRKASGSVDSDDPLVSVFYTLMRDRLPAGVLQEVCIEAARTPDAQFSNGFLATYAKYLVDLLKRKPTTASQEKYQEGWTFSWGTSHPNSAKGSGWVGTYTPLVIYVTPLQAVDESADGSILYAFSMLNDKKPVLDLTIPLKLNKTTKLDELGFLDSLATVLLNLALLAGVIERSDI